MAVTMRKERLLWQILVASILLVAYGGFFVFYEYGKNQALFVSALIALGVGLTMLTLFLIGKYRSKKKGNDEAPVEPSEAPKEEPSPDPIPEPAPKPISSQEEQPEEERVDIAPVARRPRQAASRPQAVHYASSSTVYVKQLGYGPVIEIRGTRVRDMRNNTYYHLEGGNVYEEGRGIVYQIYGNCIKSIHGSPLYELSGSNINRVFGGYYASYQGGYITSHDLSKRFEVTDSLPKPLVLFVAVLIFGER